MQDWFEQAVRPSDAQGAAPIAGAPNAWELAVTARAVAPGDRRTLPPAVDD